MAKFEIDAKNKSLGRLAGEIAILLRGKNDPKYLPHIDPENSVEVSNADKLRVTGNKDTQKMYRKYSGYPGGLKSRSLKDVQEREPNKILIKAVYGMLPKNKLRFKMIHRIIFK